MDEEATGLIPPIGRKRVDRGGRVAYLAASFPSRTETFVYNEVLELARRGWSIETWALRRTNGHLPAGLEALSEGTQIVYQGLPINVAFVVREAANHPLRALGTAISALRDAIFPGETMGLAARVKTLYQAFCGVGLAGRLRAQDISHLHCHFAHAPASVGMYAAMQLGTGFSFTGHANDLYERRMLLRRKLERAAFVACISDHHLALYEDICPDCRERTVVVRCGVDIRISGDAARTCHTPLDRSIHVLSVGRLVEKKGMDTLVDALADARKRGVRVTLTVAGEGPMRELLVSRARDAGIEEHVDFLGFVPNERVRQMMLEADVFALLCRVDSRGDRDGIPVVLMEAMAAGLPVVAGDLPAVRELVVHEETGFLVAGGDVAGAMKALAKLACDPELRARMGRAGRETIEREFTLSANVDRLEAALESVIASTRHRRAAR